MANPENYYFYYKMSWPCGEMWLCGVGGQPVNSYDSEFISNCPFYVLQS